MEYRYHIQPQAEGFARSIIPVPQDYPLREGVNRDFPIHFAKLCELVREMYLDMAQRPESYGLKLIDIGVNDHHAIRAAKNTLHRLFDTLLRLYQNGVLENHTLTVSAERFRDACKKNQGAVSNPIPKYELILSRLTDFGFAFSDFTGKPFAKTVETFTVEYPDNPEIIDTVKIYCECRDKSRNDAAKGSGNNFHHNFYSCDYKITADWNALPSQQWIRDEIRSKGYDDSIADFYVAFFEYSLKYPEIVYDGEYKYKKKRIARGLFEGLGKQNLSLILKDMDNYITTIEIMPDSVKEPFTRNSCNHCRFQGATEEYCKFRRKWTLENIQHDACAFYGFQFNDLDLARVPDYWQLLELEYRLKKV
jgi:hypothetical protein